MEVKRRYNAIRGMPSKHDLKAVRSVGPLPIAIDLRPQCSPVHDQGDIGSCTGNAIASALEFLILRQGNANLMSRLFIYWNERELEGDTGADGGAQLKTGMSAINKWGCCREATWGYSDALAFTQPVPSAYVEALPLAGAIYESIPQDIDQIRACLAEGLPFVFGFTVPESFEGPDIAATGIMQKPDPNEAQVGGHAVLAVGYDDGAQMLTVKNSWGAGWGDKGYFYMPYEVITDSSLAWDLWSIRTA